MDTKETLTIVGAGVVLAGAAFFFVRKMSAAGADTAASGTVINQPAALPTYTPVVQNYTPVGVNDSGVKTTVPGVDPSQIDPSHTDLPVVKAPEFSLPSVNLGGAGANAPGAGHAVQPDNTHTSAPGLTGNAAIIDAEYVKLFGRHADTQGLNFWDNAVKSGDFNIKDIDAHLVEGAQGADVAAAVVSAPGLVIQYRAGK